MPDEAKAIIGIILSVGVVLGVILAAIHINEKMYVEHGYVRVIVTGKNDTIWTKPECAK